MDERGEVKNVIKHDQCPDTVSAEDFLNTKPLLRLWHVLWVRH